MMITMTMMTSVITTSVTGDELRVATPSLTTTLCRSDKSVTHVGLYVVLKLVGLWKRHLATHLFQNPQTDFDMVSNIIPFTQSMYRI